MIGLNEGAKTLLDITAGVNALVVLAKILPPLAALMTVVWTGIRIYEWWKTKKMPKE